MDVFVKEMIEPAARDKTTKRGGRALARDFASRRAAAFDRAKRAVDSARFRHLLLDVVEWIDLLDNRTDAARAPIVKFGPAIMHRRIKKARKQGRRLDELTPDARHKLRIKIKTIRYGIGFFESLFTSRKARHELSDLSDRLKRIQSALGTLNDFIAHRGLATKAALRAPPADRRARAFTSGILLGKEQKAAQLLMKSASKAVHQLRPLGADLR
jgi:CHAD domain-containing protein